MMSWLVSYMMVGTSMPSKDNYHEPVMQIIKVNLSGKIISTNELYLPNNLEIIKMKMNPMGKMNFMAKYYSYQYNHDLISFMS